MHLSDLTHLTRDLQGAPQLAPDLPAQATQASLHSGTRATPSRRQKGAIIAAALAIAAAIVTPTLVTSFRDQSMTTGPFGGNEQEQKALAHAASMTVPWSTVKDELRGRAYPSDTYAPLKGLGTWRTDAETITAAFAHWEKIFGAPYARPFSLRPTSMSGERPLGRSRPRVEEWRLQGGTKGFEITSVAQDRGRDLDIFDLHDIDVAALMINIERATSTLSVDEAEVRWIDIDFMTAAPVPTIQIYVANTYDESGSMVTTLDGRIISERLHAAV